MNTFPTSHITANKPISLCLVYGMFLVIAFVMRVLIQMSFASWFVQIYRSVLTILCLLKTWGESRAVLTTSKIPSPLSIVPLSQHNNVFNSSHNCRVKQLVGTFDPCYLRHPPFRCYTLRIRLIFSSIYLNVCIHCKPNRADCLMKLSYNLILHWWCSLHELNTGQREELSLSNSLGP